jgi:hypothetical protein
MLETRQRVKTRNCKRVWRKIRVDEAHVLGGGGKGRQKQPPDLSHSGVRPSNLRTLRA